MKLLRGTQSQIGQESFVQHILRGKQEGSYVEIGAFDAVSLSNTFLLESQFNWIGISFEIDNERSQSFNTKRQNRCLTENATSCDFRAVLDELKFPIHVDYLQADIEPPKNTLKALRRALQSGRTFGVITFEHDLYASRRNRIYKLLGWILLFSHGYRRSISDVRNDRAAMEDWYIHRSIPTFERFPSGLDWRCYFDDRCSHILRSSSS